MVTLVACPQRLWPPRGRHFTEWVLVMTFEKTRTLSCPGVSVTCGQLRACVLSFCPRSMCTWPPKVPWAHVCPGSEQPQVLVSTPQTATVPVSTDLLGGCGLAHPQASWGAVFPQICTEATGIPHLWIPYLWLHEVA